ncbi:hypothetical protein CCACVL1_09608, partial [Corchorus capsularis]
MLLGLMSFSCLLTCRRISSNNFTGKIPDFFPSWKQLQKLEFQASGFEGPIPPSISSLSNMYELRISDLNGGVSKLPNLRNMSNLFRLMLRSCNISGQIPPYLFQMPNIQNIDLSFNRLTGNITNVTRFEKMQSMYLTNNSLTGPIPDWIKSIKVSSQVDLSYNNFSEDSEPPTCRETVNLFKSSSGGKNLQLSECLGNYPCLKDRYSLYINCGGEKVTIGGIDYEADNDTGGAAKYFPMISNWELSSTGHFWDMSNKTSVDSVYLAQNISVLRMNDSELYTTARLSPLSLTYYIRCLGKGNYTVKLHFAEIVIRGNSSFYSLGRRIFDVYIQGNLRLKDFNIKRTAKGVDKEYVHEFKAVAVRDKTLEIRFRWAGKGTTDVPKRGTYGPLISAISVKSEFKPPNDRQKKILIVVGAVVLFLLLVFMILGALWWKGLWDRISREEGNALVEQQKGNLMELVDPKLGTEFNKEEAMTIIKVALLCTNSSPALRPTMSQVVSMLEGRTAVHEITSTDPGFFGDQIGFKSFSNFDQSPIRSSDTHSLVRSSDSHSLVRSSDSHSLTAISVGRQFNKDNLNHSEESSVETSGQAMEMTRSPVLLLSLMIITVMSMEALKVEAQAAGELSRDEGNNHTSWKTPKSADRPLLNNTLLCNCSFPGNVCHVEMIVLNANNLTGKLPQSLTNLTKLTELRISSNNFTGKIPDFFPSWKQLQKLEIQASGFEGPIPPSISNLSNMYELRISDLNGGVSELPYLRNMNSLFRLMVRSCNISGQIPHYLFQMPQVQIIDLSFNRFRGNIPNVATLDRMEKMYLTNNSISGPIPDWIKSLSSRSQADLSYNNFSEDSVPPTCRETLQLSECLGNHPCSKDRYSLYINCGGGKVTVKGIDYEADNDQGGEAKYVPINNNWEVSSTGHFWDTDITSNDYVAHNVSVLRMNDSELYTTARLSPLSLTYYIRCLGNGNYTVKLHFAEIVIRDNSSFYSLGRRIFDVYIQGNRRLKDFDIENTAKGVDKEYIHEFKAVTVRDKTLEIRFHWAGKGTTAAPKRGTYGPLISAISVKSKFNPPNDRQKTIFIVVGAVVLFLVLVFMILGALWWKGLLWDRISREEELRGLDLKTGIFTLRQIKAATNNFDAANKLGEGGFGIVYKVTYNFKSFLFSNTLLTLS